MTDTSRLAEIRIEHPHAWYLMQHILNEYFNCSMFSVPDKRDTGGNMQMVRLTGVTEKGKAMLMENMDYLSIADEYKEGLT